VKGLEEMTRISDAVRERHRSGKPIGRSREGTAHRLGDVHLRTVDRLLRDGKLKGYRVGRRVLVCDDSIDAYLAEQAI
jgi:excisionase family DNA binding protein